MEILNKILEKIKEYDKIIIHGHKRPDGDCYGGQFGLKNIIQTSFPKKEVYVVGQTSGYVDFVGQVDTISDDMYEGALSIVVDTATEERISDERYKLGKELIKIDHHIPIDQYGDYIWVDTNFPAVSQMIAYFFLTFEDELKMTAEGATAMYTGIVTDTGRFRYRGVSRLTHELAGLLVEKGADIVAIDKNLSKETMEEYQFKGNLLSKVQFDDAGFAYAVITKDDIKKFNITSEAAAANVNLLSGVEGYGVWFLLIEGDDEVRVRLRSSDLAIDKLANMFDGGGHKNASGASLSSFDEKETFLKAVRKYILENK